MSPPLALDEVNTNGLPFPFSHLPSCSPTIVVPVIGRQTEAESSVSSAFTPKFREPDRSRCRARGSLWPCGLVLVA